MNLSKNFQLSEFVISDKAAELKIDNTPSQEIINNLKDLVTNVLQPFRDAINSDTDLLKRRNRSSFIVKISSGYRCPALNAAIKGSKTSDHVFGRAADIKIRGLGLKEICYYILKMNLDFDQLILEPSWIHIGYRKGNNRKQVLTKLSNGDYAVGLL